MRRYVVLITAALGLLVLAAAVALLTTQAGARWAFSLLVGRGVVAKSVGGSLWGALEIGELQIATPTTSARLLRLRLDWSPLKLVRDRVVFATLDVGSVEIEARGGGEPWRLPASLALPLPVEQLGVHVDSVRLEGPGLPAPQVIMDLKAMLSSDGLDHRLAWLQARAQWGGVMAEGRLHGAQPYALSATVKSGFGLARGQVDFTARAGGTLEGFDVELDANARDFKGRAHARMTPFAPLPLAGVEVAVDAFNPATFLAGAPRAELALSAKWALHRGPDGLQLSGPLTLANRAPATLDAGGVPLDRAQSQVVLSSKGVRFESLQASLFQGGAIRGRAQLEKAGVSAAVTLAELNLRGVDRRLAQSRLKGELKLDSADGRHWHAHGALADARLAAQFAARADVDAVVVERFRLEGGGGHASGTARLALKGERDFEFAGELAQFDPSRWAALPRAAISARIEGAGALSPQWSARVSLALHDSRIHTPTGVRPLGGAARFAVSAQRLSQVDVSLDLAGNQLTARGALGGRGDVLEVLARMPGLAALGQGVAGRLEGTAQLRGTFAEPSASVDLTASDLTFAEVAARSLRLQGELQDGAAGRLDVTARAEGLRAKGELLAEALQASARGTRTRNALELALQLPARLGGGKLTALARGGLDTGLQWRGMMEQLAHQGDKLPLALEAPAPLAMGLHEARLSQARLQGRRVRVLLDDTRWTPAGVVARGSLSGLAVSAPGWVEGGLQVGARWSVSTERLRQAELAVFREAGDLRVGGELPVSLGLADARLDVGLKGSRLVLTGAASGARLGEVSARLEASVAPTDWALMDSAPIDGRLALTMPSIDWVGPLLDPNLKTAGELRGEIRLSGTAAAPIAQGQVRAERLLVALVEEGLRLQEGVAVVDFSQGQAQVSADFSVPQRPLPPGAPFEVKPRAGRFSVRGELDLTKTAARLDFKAERANVLAREGQWLMASGEGRLVASREGAKIEGRARVDAALINYQKRRFGALSDDVVVIGRDKPAARRFLLDVEVLAEMGDQCHIRAEGLAARLDGQVRLRAHAGAPLFASGSIRAVDGVFDAYGQTLAIERGVVNFQGPLDNPGLNVRAIRRGLAVEAGVEVLGTAQAPKVRLVSDPSVPDAEKLSWIVLGRGMDQAGGGAGADSALLLSAANAILGGREGKGLPQQLARALGFDEVSVGAAERDGSRAQTTVAGSVGTARDQGLPGTVVQVGKRLSTSAYLSYEHSLLGLESVVKLTYALTRRISLVARTGTDNAVDVFYTFSFD